MRDIAWIYNKQYFKEALNRLHFTFRQQFMEVTEFVTTTRPILTTIGVKIVETLLSFRVDFKLGAQMAPSPAPLGQCCVFLFSTSLVDSGTTLIRVREGGYPGNVLFGQVFFSNNECVVASVFCWKLSQLILSPIVG